MFTVSLDMPGIKREDVNIELKDNQLYVSGERKKTITDSETVLKTEKVYGKCARVFTLPKNVKAENIEARFENGVLEIMIPKEEKTLPRKISITDWKETELKN
jgi:HSP20 family protein